MAGLIGKCSRSGDHANHTLLVDSSGHDADLALFWSDDAGAVGTDQPGLALSRESVLHADHVLGNNV